MSNKASVWEKLVDREIIRKNLMMYNKVTGLTCFAIDKEGNPFEFTGQKYTFCGRFQEGVEDKMTCQEGHLYSGKVAEMIGEPYIYFCPAGMVHWTSPIIFNGEFYGAIIAGPVQMSQTDDYIIEEVGQKHDLDENIIKDLKTYVKLIPVVNTEKVRYLAEMLFTISKEIIKEEVDILLDRKKMYQEQARINEKIQDIKINSVDMNEIDFFKSEKELMQKVKMGDKIGAKTILNEILGIIYFQSGNDFETIKVRIVELISMLSRAAVEGGAKQDIVFGMNNKYLKKLFEIESFEFLTKWLVEVLDRFTDSVFKVNSSEKYYVISKAISYINEYFSENISLEQVADHVFLNPTTFSRLFKKEVGMNFSEYTNIVRIEESKKYLIDPQYSLSQIALMVGFTDQSYFSKIFKKSEGLSPGQYRKLNK